jgi:hypothetical protein
MTGFPSANAPNLISRYHPKRLAVPAERPPHRALIPGGRAAALRFGGHASVSLPVFGLRNFWKYHKEAAKAAAAMGVQAEFSRWTPWLTAKILKVIHGLTQAGVDLRDTMVIVNRNFHTMLEKFFDGKAAGAALDLRQFAQVTGRKFPLPERLSHINHIVSFCPNPLSHWVQFLVRGLEAVSAKLRTKSKIHRPPSPFLWSSWHSLHDVIHEFVHVLHAKNQYKNAPVLSEALMPKTFPDSFWKQVTQSIGVYAGKSRNPNELIAEIGTAQLVGKKLSLTPEIEQLWKDYWQGPELPFGIFAKPSP